MTEFLGGRVSLLRGDCREMMRDIPENSIDSVVTDPPYHLASIVKRFGGDNAAPAQFGTDGVYKRASTGFMGKTWDGGDIAFDPATWAAVLRVLKPGGHLVAFGAPKNAHRLTCAIEDAGFEIRDCVMWLFGTGFPKSHDVSKGIDKAAGVEREIVGRSVRHGGGTTETIPDFNRFGSSGDFVTAPATDEAAKWEGWGTALKPAYEPIILARKLLAGTVAANVLEWGTGAINVDGCRIQTDDNLNGGAYSGEERFRAEYTSTDAVPGAVALSRLKRGVGGFNSPLGRWPANVVHDGSYEVLAAFPDTAPSKANAGRNGKDIRNVFSLKRGSDNVRGHDDAGGSAARFFFSAKADGDDRLGSKHPTVKPIDLMRWLCRLITPPGGTVLDPFAGTGSTGEAAYREGFNAVLIEREEEYQADIERRMKLILSGPGERSRESAKAKNPNPDPGPLFGGEDGAKRK